MDLSLKVLTVADEAHISLREFFFTFPIGIGILLHGVMVLSGRIVKPKTPAAHPPEGTSLEKPSRFAPIEETKSITSMKQ